MQFYHYCYQLLLLTMMTTASLVLQIFKYHFSTVSLRSGLHDKNKEINPSSKRGHNLKKRVFLLLGTEFRIWDSLIIILKNPNNLAVKRRGIQSRICSKTLGCNLKSPSISLRARTPPKRHLLPSFHPLLPLEMQRGGSRERSCLHPPSQFAVKMMTTFMITVYTSGFS